MRTLALTLFVLTLTGCNNLGAQLLGRGTFTYNAAYTDLQGRAQPITVNFEIRDNTIQEFSMKGTAEGEERGHQLAAEANARPFIVGKAITDVALPPSVGDEPQRPITGALQEVVERLKEDLS